MINGFEQITSPLTEHELELVPLFVKGLSNKIGKENAVKSSHILSAMQQYRLTGARIRKIINYIRINGLVKNLIASSDGYYIETNPEKIKKYVKSLRQRASAINAVADSYILK